MEIKSGILMLEIFWGLALVYEERLDEKQAR